MGGYVRIVAVKITHSGERLIQTVAVYLTE